MTPPSFRLRCLLPGAAAVLLASFAAAKDAPDRAPASPTARQEAAVVSHLSAALGWYHRMQAANTWKMLPADEFYRSGQQDLDRQVLVGAFAYARAMASSLAAGAQAGGPAAADSGGRTARLASLAATNAERLAELAAEERELNGSLAAANAGERPALQARLEVVKAEEDLDSALAQSLEKGAAALGVANRSGAVASLPGQIDALERSVPEIDAAPENPPGKPVTAPELSSSDGLINRASALFSLLRTRRAMDKLIAEADSLGRGASALGDSLAGEIRGVIAEGNDRGDRARAGSDPGTFASARATVERDAVRFRELSAALLPLRQEAAALARSSSNLAEWRASLAAQTDSIMRVFFARAIALAIALAVLMGLSELWRRATFKYVHDARRRRQLLLIRRFVTGFLVVLAVTIGVVSDFSSLATFAGFITAGIAVALQTVILSVAAYFFLIGRYGVKVGDRLTVSGVTGDVIDIGLVRVFLMELAGTGVNLHPTGRIVILANSALFSSTPVYKQLPGTAYAWHEVFVTMAADVGTVHAEERLLAAVNAVYAGYRPSLEHQSGTVERLLDVQLDVPVPKSHVGLAEAGVEVVVRYPAEISRMAEIDRKVTNEVLKMLNDDEALKKSITGMPRIRAAVKG